MTTYAHGISLNDGERIALEAALKLMIEHCDEQMANGPCAPFWAYRKHCVEIGEKLRFCTPVMTSTSTFRRET